MNNSCFFLHNHSTDHIEFHYRTNKNEINKKKTFKSFVYVPDYFEKYHLQKSFMIKFTSKFFFNSFFNNDLNSRMEIFDKKFLNKWKTHFCIKVLAFPFVFLKTGQQIDKYFLSTNFYTSKCFRIRRFLVIYAIPFYLCIHQIHKILSHKRIFLTGNLLICLN